MMTPGMATTQFPELQSTCAALGFPLSEESIHQFSKFMSALYEWNMQKNLTRIPPEQCEVRHFAESCLVLEFFEGGKVLDVGTGPGFPAWPIACAAPATEVVAIDSNGKMLEFLVSQPLPNLTAVLGRVEEQEWIEEFDLVTGRALAPLPAQLELSAPCCKVGGRVVPYRSVSEEFSLECMPELGLELESVQIRTLSDGVPRALPVYVKTSQTQTKYPRPWAIMKKKPLS